MTGYEFSRNWFDWAFENPDKINSSHTALYMWFVEKWNRCGHVEKISITTSENMAAIGMSSRNTHAKILNDLIEFGFVIMVKKSTNQYSNNIISLAQKRCGQDASKRTALDQALIQHDSEQDASIDTYNKQVNNKTSKKENKETMPNLKLPYQSEKFKSTWEVLKSEPKWRKKTYHALEISLQKLKEFPEDVAIKMMENSISGGWQGLFEIKNTYNKSNDKPEFGITAELEKFTPENMKPNFD